MIARRAAAELQVNAIVNLGFGISAAIPRVLLEGATPRTSPG